MMSHSNLPNTERTLSPDSTEAESVGLSTYDDLQQYRRTELYAKSLSSHRRTIEDFRRVIAGEAVVCDLEGSIIDVSRTTYERDYAGLGEYFEGRQLNERLVEVRPMKRHDAVADRQTAVRDLLAASPFRQQLQGVVDELDGLISLSPEPGVYELTTRLDEANGVDGEVLAMIAGKDVLRANERDGASSVEVIISDEAMDGQWLDTASAQAFLGALDQAGIHLTEEARRELAVESDSRYGNAYAWISREIVKQIAGYAGHLIENSDETMLPERTSDAGADVLIDVLRQLRLRGKGPYPSDIPVTKEYVELRDKGCKDVEAYFAQSIDLPDKLTTVSINGKRFWHKTHGGHTFINLDPIVYNGVELPPGYLFKQTEDGGYALLRATGFVFDKPTADSLFGAPMTETYEVPGEEALMVRTFEEFARLRNDPTPNR